MISNGVTLAEAMQPPRLPVPFLYRPLESGGADPSLTAKPQPEEKLAAKHVIDSNTRYLMRVGCGTCGARHWLPAREGARRRLWINYTPELHARGSGGEACCHAAMSIKLSPCLRKVAEGYCVWGEGGDEGRAAVEVRMAAVGPATVSVSLGIRRGVRMEVSEMQAVAEDED